MARWARESAKDGPFQDESGRLGRCLVHLAHEPRPDVQRTNDRRTARDMKRPAAPDGNGRSRCRIGQAVAAGIAQAKRRLSPTLATVAARVAEAVSPAPAEAVPPHDTFGLNDANSPLGLFS